MPDQQPTYEQLQKLDPAGRLLNPDLRPAKPEQRQWRTYDLFAFWSNTSHNLGAYTFAAGMFALGLNGWEIVVGFLLASIIVYAGCLASGFIGQDTKVPFPVVSRMSWGVYGANIPALIRALAAIGWYGIQTYLASTALDVMFARFVPGMAALQMHEVLGLGGLSWISFMILWAIQLVVMSRGMEVVRHVQGWSGGVIWLLMLAIGAFMFYKSNGAISLSSHGGHEALSPHQQLIHTLAISGLIMGILGPLMLNYADFTRFAPSKRSVLRGTIWGVPINWTVFAATSVLISLGSLTVYGKAFLNPEDIFSQLTSPVLLLVGGFLLTFAAVGVNIVANFVSPAFDLSNCWPDKISFRLGGLITAFIALASLPWKLYSTPVVINYFLGGLGAMIGPLFGIMVVDYYLVKRKKVDMQALFNSASTGRYYYKSGTNPKAVLAFLIGCAFSLSLSLIESLSEYAPLAWYLGAFMAGLVYFLVSLKTHKN